MFPLPTLEGSFQPHVDNYSILAATRLKPSIALPTVLELLNLSLPYSFLVVPASPVNQEEDGHHYRPPLSELRF